jgi:nucleotide-binding universal stress UspA family protein
MTADETEQHELEAQLQTATKALQKAVMRLLQDRDIHPHLVVLALARATGEVGAGTALADEQNPEELLDDLAKVARKAGREFHDMVRLEAAPGAGSA